MCCLYHVLLEDVQSAARKACSQSNIDYIVNHIQGLAGEALELLCSDVKKDSEVCLTLEENLPKINFTGQEKSTSFMPALLQVLESL